MTKNLKYALIALSIIVVVGAITQSPAAVLASLAGAGWAKLHSKFWHNAYKRPPGGGKGIRVTKNKVAPRMSSNLSFA